MITFYVHRRKKILVASPVNAANSGGLPVFSRKSRVPMRIQFVDDNPAGGISNQLQIVDVTPFSLQVYWGQYNTPQADQTTWAKDTDNEWFEADFDFNTDLIETAFGAGTAVLSGYFEIHLRYGSEREVFTFGSSISPVVYNPDAPDPVTYTPPDNLLELLVLAFADSTDIHVERVGDTFQWTLKDAGRRTVFEAVANQTAMLALAAKKGDAAIRTDVNRIFELTTNSPSTLADWVEMPVTFNWLGVYNAGTTYTIGDAVSRSSSAFISQQAGNLNHDPANPANVGTGQPWGLLAAGSALQLGINTPATETVGDVGAVGTSLKAAHEDHRHPMPGLVTESSDGFESAVDKSRFDLTETGVANGKITLVLQSGNYFYIFGEFTTWDNVARPGSVKVDKRGKIVPQWNVGGRFHYVPTDQYYALDKGCVLADGSIVVGLAGGKTAHPSAPTVQKWFHRLDPETGQPVPGFNAPDDIAELGSNSINCLAAVGTDLLAVISWQTLRIMDYTGATVFTETGGTNFHQISGIGTKLLLTQRPTSAYGATLNPRAVKLLDFASDPSTGLVSGAIDSVWSSNGGTGGDFSANGIALSPDGSFAIVEEQLLYGGTTHTWNSGEVISQYLIKLITTGSDRGRQALDFTVQITKASEDARLQPLCVNSLGEVFFTGDALTVNSVSVPANQICRVDAEGASLLVIGGFTGGKIVSMTRVDDNRYLVLGEFTAFNGLPIGRLLMIDRDGRRIHTLEPDAAGGDMYLAASQEVTGAKTFDDGTLKVNDGTNAFAHTFHSDATTARDVTFPDKSGTVRFEPKVDVLDFASSMDIDFAGSEWLTLTLAGDFTFTTSGRAAGRTVRVKVTCDGTNRVPTWPATWNWVGDDTPTLIDASSVGELTLFCYGTTDADIIARWRPEGAVGGGGGGGGFLPLTGGVLTGATSFSGTGHAGLKVNNLTTTQRNALALGTGDKGFVIYNTTSNQLEVWSGSAWGAPAIGSFVSKAGDTMTGMLTLPSTTPTNVNHATRKGYVDGKVTKSGDTMNGSLSFTGSTNPGLKVNSLTATQRDALTPANGMIIFNTTTGYLNAYLASSGWFELVSAGAPIGTNSGGISFADGNAGIRVGRLTTAQRDALFIDINATQGYIIYNTDARELQWWWNDGAGTSGWNTLGSAAVNSYSSMTGAGTDYTLTGSTARVDFGTTDAQVMTLSYGTFLLLANVQIQGDASGAGDEVRVKLRNATDGADIGVERSVTIPYASGFAAIDLIEIVASTLVGKTIQIFAYNATSARGKIISMKTTIRWVRLY